MDYRTQFEKSKEYVAYLTERDTLKVQTRSAESGSTDKKVLSLQRVLETPTTCAVFMNYLSKMAAANELLFYLDIAEFKSFPKSQYKNTEARRIYRMYVERLISTLLPRPHSFVFPLFLSLSSPLVVLLLAFLLALYL